jgi:anaerobic dimethyl sulfoxide reductase subunit B (iron-sulfur subunit)
VTKQAFAIDLERCTGCQTCAVACQDRARRPDHTSWLWVQECEVGRYPSPRLSYRPTHCYHCAKPACAAACPTSAIVKEKDGLVQIDRELCTRCGACVQACPFSAIATESDGIVSKCDGCADEIAAGSVPTCVRACPMRAMGYLAIEALPPAGRVADPDFDDRGIGPAVVYLIRAPKRDQ